MFLRIWSHKSSINFALCSRASHSIRTDRRSIHDAVVFACHTGHLKLISNSSLICFVLDRFLIVSSNLNLSRLTDFFEDSSFIDLVKSKLKAAINNLLVEFDFFSRLVQHSIKSFLIYWRQRLFSNLLSLSIVHIDVIVLNVILLLVVLRLIMLLLILLSFLVSSHFSKIHIHCDSRLNRNSCFWLLSVLW